MNDWMLLALMAPFFWTLSDFIDKFVIESCVEGIYDFLFSFSLASWIFLIALVSYFGIPTNFDYSLTPVLLGFSTTASFYFYAKGLQYADTSLAILTFKFLPIMAIFLGYIFYSHNIEFNHLMASILVLIGGSYIFFSMEKGKLVYNEGIPWIILSVLMWAIIFVIADKTLENMSFENYIVLDVFGACLVSIPLVFCKKSFSEIKIGFNKFPRKRYIWFFLNTLADFIAQVMVKKSFSLAPSIGAVTVLTQIQSIYGIVIGIFITIFFPNVIKEDISIKTLFKKSLGSIIIIFGIYIAILD